MKGNILIGIIIFVIIAAIGLMIYFNVRPGNKLYENNSYGFKTEYLGTWQELGGEYPKIVTFIDEIDIDFRTNTDIYVYPGEDCDLKLKELTEQGYKTSDVQTTMKIAGKTVDGLVNTETEMYNQTIYQEYICLEHADHLYVIVNTAKDMQKQMKNFNIIKNTFAFTAISPEQFGGIGDVVSSLRQKYQQSVPAKKIFEWEYGNETVIYEALFYKDMIHLQGGYDEGDIIGFDFIVKDPMVNDIAIEKGKQTDETVELIYEQNIGYTIETITKTYNKETGLPVKIKVESDAGSFEIKLRRIEENYLSDISCDAVNSCPDYMECADFLDLGLGPLCYTGDACELAGCEENKCVIAKSYPVQVYCQD